MYVMQFDTQTLNHLIIAGITILGVTASVPLIFIILGFMSGSLPEEQVYERHENRAVVGKMSFRLQHGVALKTYPLVVKPAEDDGYDECPREFNA